MKGIYLLNISWKKMWAMFRMFVTLCCYIWGRSLRRRDTNFGSFCLCTAVTLKLMMSEIRHKNK